MYGAGLDTATQNGLGVYYLLVALLNVGFAAYCFLSLKKVSQALVWTVVAGVFFVHAVAYFLHLGWTLSEGIRDAVDWAVRAESFFSAAVIIFVLLLVFRKQMTEPAFAWAVLNAGLFGAGWAMTNKNFREVVTKPDNVPIVMLV